MKLLKKLLVCAAVCLSIFSAGTTPVKADNGDTQNHPTSNPYVNHPIYPGGPSSPDVDSSICMAKAWQMAADYGVILPEFYYDYSILSTTQVSAWYYDAMKAGYTCDSTPSPNSIAVFTGHVAYVVEVYSDGSLHVIEGNYGGRVHDSAVNPYRYISSQIGTHLYGMAINELVGFLHLDIPRKVSDPYYTDVRTAYVSNSNVHFVAQYHDDLSHENAPTDVGVLFSESKESLDAATVESHSDVLVAHNDSQSELNSLYHSYNGVYYSNYDIQVSDGAAGQTLEEGTVYYYKYYVTTYGTTTYSDVKNFRTTSSSVSVLHRLYNPNSGEHFYTSNVDEQANLVSVGWIDEGDGWYAPVHSNTPVYRLYNANGGEHHYTTNADERDHLVQAGWIYEGIGWYSDDQKSVPLHREYNPNQFSCNHNYTTDISEHNYLVSIGWKDEGICWYGIN